MLKITLGSTSAHKLKALEAALEELKIPATLRSASVKSGLDEQPVGFSSTYSGAHARASKALSMYQDNDLGIGIESGIFRYRTHAPVTVSLAVVVVLGRNGQKIVSTSPGLMLPEEYVITAMSRGFKTTTVGSVIAEKLGGDPTDPYATLTQGKFVRSGAIAQALKIALSQI